ncbi:MAG: NAD(P)H-quinone oxidoreductase [Sandaracinaceae bacterium]|nr:NAD(P)H-quinone oxidoreductase [Myxococcales bacterium]MCB9594517.1 NAD(P)H-quinone oxidoreductase [Sandaracinaceae bacterium]
MARARAVRIRAPGGPEVLELVDVEVPDPGPGQVLVEVAASALNRADLLQRRGLYPAPPGSPLDIPGLEYAGRVAVCGEGVSVAVGDPVMGITGGGGMATLLRVHERELVPVPEGMPLEQAAAIPEAFMTAFDAMFEQAELAAGERVLVHAVASGVGTAAIQLAASAGARALGTSRTADKLERIDGLAPFTPLHVPDGKFADAARAAVGGVDVILDLVGGAYLEENLRALAPRGRMVVVGLVGGVAAPMPLGLLLAKRLRVFGSVLRARPLEEKAALAQRFSRLVVPRFASGELRPVVDAVLPMREVAEAHARMERNETVGKLVLSWG